MSEIDDSHQSSLLKANSEDLENANFQITTEAHEQDTAEKRVNPYPIPSQFGINDLDLQIMAL